MSQNSSNPEGGFRLPYAVQIFNMKPKCKISAFLFIVIVCVRVFEPNI
jgi:hypothetical protein